MLFMVTNRRIIDGQYSDEERPAYKYEYLYDYDAKPADQDGFIKKGQKGFETALLQELVRLRDEEGVSTPKVGLFVHGYNTTFQESIDQIVDLEKSLKAEIGYAPVIVGFSWPSSGKVANYLSDREEVRDTVPAFTRFLLDINNLLTNNERECFSTTYCITHSMGNYLLRKGMEYLSDALGSPMGRMMFAETLMIAPDLASSDMELGGKGQYIMQFSRRVHVYYSKFDRALKASSTKRFGGNRLGRHGANDYANLPRNLICVDVKNFANSTSLEGLKDRRGGDVSVHSACRYHPSILQDMIQVMASHDRQQIPGREPIPYEEGLHDFGNHFQLVDA